VPIRYRCRVAAYSTLRASDADRDAVAERLRRAAVEGRLEPDELEQRLEAAFRARTYGELNRLLVDLPAPPGARSRHRTIAAGAWPRDRGLIVAGARTAAAVVIPIVVALVTVLAIAAVIVVAAAGWMVWMLIALLVCGSRRHARRHRPVTMRRPGPAGLL
jgi:lysylphosphatidylglycerol synthetase-like protein (DUF2156 family)